MWKMIFVAIAIAAIQMYVSNNNADRDAAMIAEQSKVQAEIEAHHTKATSDLAKGWQQFYSQLTSQKEAELKVIAERINAEPTSAIGCKTAEKQRQ